MTKILALAMFLLGIYFFKIGAKFEDKEAAGYLTKIRMIGAAILLFIGAIALFFKSSL